MFAVTPQTIRRDINQLAEQGLLRRYHGGAAYDSEHREHRLHHARRPDARREAAHRRSRGQPGAGQRLAVHQHRHHHRGHRPRPAQPPQPEDHHHATCTWPPPSAPRKTSKCWSPAAPYAATAASSARPRWISSSSSASTSPWSASAASTRMAACSDFDHQEVRVSQAIIDNARQRSWPPTRASSGATRWSAWDRSRWSTGSSATARRPPPSPA